MSKTNAPRFSRALEGQRRGSKRYEISLTLRYAVRRRGQEPVTGTGRSINISSSGLLLVSDGQLAVGDSIIIALEWPVANSAGEEINLVLSGYVVRTHGAWAAVLISRNEILRPSEFEKSLDIFSRRAWKPPAKRPLTLTPIALIDDDETASAAVEAVLRPHGWETERADSETARRILASGIPPIRLLITRTIDLLDELTDDLPVILTLEEGLPQDASEQLVRMRRLVIVRKPIIYGELRRAILQFCQQTSPLAAGLAV